MRKVLTKQCLRKLTIFVLFLFISICSFSKETTTYYAKHEIYFYDARVVKIITIPNGAPVNVIEIYTNTARIEYFGSYGDVILTDLYKSKESLKRNEEIKLPNEEKKLPSFSEFIDSHYRIVFQLNSAINAHYRYLYYFNKSLLEETDKEINDYVNKIASKNRISIDEVKLQLQDYYRQAIDNMDDTLFRKSCNFSNLITWLNYYYLPIDSVTILSRYTKEEMPIGFIYDGKSVNKTFKYDVFTRSEGNMEYFKINAKEIVQEKIDEYIALPFAETPTGFYILINSTCFIVFLIVAIAILTLFFSRKFISNKYAQLRNFYTSKTIQLNFKHKINSIKNIDGNILYFSLVLVVCFSNAFVYFNHIHFKFWLVNTYLLLYLLLSIWGVVKVFKSKLPKPPSH